MEIGEAADEEFQEISYAEIVLYDVINDVFKYLNVYDLSQASKVCKSWHHAAKKEKSRRGPQIMILQALEDLVATGFSSVRIMNKNVQVDDYKSSLRIKPKVGLFFTDGKYPASADCDSVPFEICSAHQWTQPECNFCVAVEAFGVNVNGDLIRGEKNITGAVFLPDLPTASYALAETSSHHIERYNQTEMESTLNEITDGLFLPDAQDRDRVCFIIFMYQWKDEPTYENHHNKFLTKILENLSLRYKPGTISLWGAAVSDIFAVSADCAKPLHHSTSFCALKILGACVDSWSIVLNVKWPASQIIALLNEFKAKVSLRASSLALLIAPVTSENDINQFSIRIFQSVFPSVKIVSIFNDESHFVLSLNSTSCEYHQEMKHLNCFAFLIITYK